jgi:release factor glutamine methyltransferase
MGRAAVDQAMGLRALLGEGARTLCAAGLGTARREAEWLLADALGVTRLMLYTDPPAVDEETARRYRARLQRRAAHEPLQYVLGWEEFRGLRFRVSPAVLIPRPETEGLVEWVLELTRAGATVCDVGTGSGCIAGAIATARPDVRVIAVDRSSAALALAAENLAALGVRERVTLVAADLDDALAASRQAVDVVVANPPYIPRDVLARLPAEVRDWEPREALDGGPDGMTVHRRIVAASPAAFRREGWLVMEMGDGQADLLADTLGAAGFVDVERRRDPGGVERYVAGRYVRAPGEQA